MITQKDENTLEETITKTISLQALKDEYRSLKSEYDKLKLEPDEITVPNDEKFMRIETILARRKELKDTYEQWLSQ